MMLRTLNSTVQHAAKTVTRATDLKGKGMHYALKKAFDEYLIIERDDITDISITSTRFKLNSIDIRQGFINDMVRDMQQPMLLKAGFIENMMVDNASALWSKEEKDWSIVLEGVHLLFVVQEREKRKPTERNVVDDAAAALKAAKEQSSNYMGGFFGSKKVETKPQVADVVKQQKLAKASSSDLMKISEDDEEEEDDDEDDDDDDDDDDDYDIDNDYNQQDANAESKASEEGGKKGGWGWGWGKKPAGSQSGEKSKPQVRSSINSGKKSKTDSGKKSKTDEPSEMDDRQIDLTTTRAANRLALTIKKMYIRVEDPVTKVAVGVVMDISVKKESDSTDKSTDESLGERIAAAAAVGLQQLDDVSHSKHGSRSGLRSGSTDRAHGKSSTSEHKKQSTSAGSGDHDHLVKEVRISKPQFYCNCKYEEHDAAAMADMWGNNCKLKDEKAFVKFMKQSMARRSHLSDAGMQYLDPILNEVLPEASSMVVVVEQNLLDQEKQTISQMRLENALSLSFQQLQLQAMARFALSGLQVGRLIDCTIHTLHHTHSVPYPHTIPTYHTHTPYSHTILTHHIPHTIYHTLQAHKSMYEKTMEPKPKPKSKRRSTMSFGRLMQRRSSASGTNNSKH
jgi:hypothetical protein